MITTITISNNKRTPFRYAPEIKAFKNGTEFVFKPGVNIIIGKNGSGKSTLMSMIAKYMLCENKMCSYMPREALDFPDVFDDNEDVLDGVCIKADYAGKVFNLSQQNEMKDNDVFDNAYNFSLFMDGMSSSCGEKGLRSMSALFSFMFSQKDYAFPILGLADLKKKSNELWAKKIDNLLRYYKSNRTTLTKDTFEYTVLMDEPDRNLDIDNIMQVYEVLSFHKPQTQIIAVIHNQALIYKLSELDHVNFIEMTEGYLNKVVDFVFWSSVR